MAARHCNCGYIGITAVESDTRRARTQRPLDGVMGYPSCMAYSQDELDLIDRTEEVEIETSGPSGDTHRTIIWAVVDGDSVFVRSYRGANARWYREASANPSVALHVDGRRLAGHRRACRRSRVDRAHLVRPPPQVPE